MTSEPGGEDRSVRGRDEIDQSHLPYAAALVASGVADLVAMLEAHVDANGVRKLRQWVNLAHQQDVKLVGAPRQHLRP